MSNVLPFRPRAPRIEPCVETPIPLYRLTVTRAKGLGMCPDAANDARGDDELASLLELSIRAVVESRTGSRGS